MAEHRFFPIGSISTAEELGAAIRAQRRALGLTQEDVAGLSGVGLRFLGELERGKPTVQLGKALQVLSDLGLEVEVRPRGSNARGSNAECPGIEWVSAATVWYQPAPGMAERIGELTADAAGRCPFSISRNGPGP